MCARLVTDACAKPCGRINGEKRKQGGNQAKKSLPRVEMAATFVFNRELLDLPLSISGDQRLWTADKWRRLIET